MIRVALSRPRHSHAPEFRMPYDVRMEMGNGDTADALERILCRSYALHEKVLSLLEGADYGDSPRDSAAIGMCGIALEHGAALRALMALRLPTSAVGLMRLQFEAVTRAMWLIYATSDEAAGKLLAPMNAASERAAKSLPGASEMIAQIGKRVGQGAPAAAYEMLVRFKDASWHAMNSFVHGGIHPLQRSAAGFPIALALQVLRNSNGLSTMTGMTLALLTCNESVFGPMSRIQPEFSDCLPELVSPPAGGCAPP